MHPQSVVDKLRVPTVASGLETQFVAREDQAFQRTMRRNQHNRRRTLVNFARFHADDAILDQIDSTNTMRARDRVETADERETGVAARIRNRLQEIDRYVGRSDRRP